jgi:DNA-binding NtrC family response regulator
MRHRWPGNVRELQNVIERACILAEEGNPVGFDLMGLPSDSQSRPAPEAPPAAAPSAAALPAAAPAPLLGQPLRELEKAAILQALDLSGGNRTKAAEALQISIRTLRNKLAEYRGGGELPEVVAEDSSD